MPIPALVLEDDRAWQTLLAEILTDQGLAVQTASSLPEALLAIKNAAHRLAIVDLSLDPHDHDNHDGLRALEALRLQNPACRAILLTGYATVEVAVSALSEHGAFAFLRKENFQPAELRDLTRRILASAPPAPKSGAASLAAPESAPPTERPPLARALLVDDDAGWRDILAELLADAGYSVRPCNSYGEALGCLKREKYALAVLDLSLNGADPWQAPPTEDHAGYDLLDATEKMGLPALIVSGVSGVEAIQRAYQRPNLAAFLEKQTFERAAFQRALQSLRPTINDSGLQSLTEREKETLHLLAEGLTNKEIAEKLVITPNTVKRHLKSIFEKLGVHTRAGAAARALKE